MDVDETMPITAQAETSIHAPAEVVWTALTEPEQIRKYFLGADVTTDWEVGHPITWSGEYQGRSFEDHGQLLVVDPVRELAFTHWSPMSGTEDSSENYHIVRIDLTEQDGRTDVSLTQANLDGHVSDADRAARDDYERNWSTVLQGLKETAESLSG